MSKICLSKETMDMIKNDAIKSEIDKHTKEIKAMAAVEAAKFIKESAWFKSYIKDQVREYFCDGFDFDMEGALNDAEYNKAWEKAFVAFAREAADIVEKRSKTKKK